MTAPKVMNAAALAVVVAAALVVSACGVSAQPGKVVFSDDFSSGFDLSKWKHEITMGGGGNWEFEYYLNNRSNSWVENGILNLKPTFTADTIGEANLKSGYTMDLWGADPASLCTGNSFYGCSRTSGAGGNYINPIQSARIRTAETFTFKYGRVDIRAKLPAGDWVWPAMWMLPRHEAYGTWPASGEIDIMESRGNDPSYPAGGRDTFGSTLHWGPFFPEDPFAQTHATYKMPKGDLSMDFHNYTLVWNETGITTLFDNVPVLHVDTSKQSFWERGGWANSSLNNPWKGSGVNAPFDQEFYLIFNVAVGGTNSYFPDGVGGKTWTDTDPHAVNAFWDSMATWSATWGNNTVLQIDSVTVTQ